jgi:hypothetical protein
MFKVNDYVRINKYPEGNINSVARVVDVGEDFVLVSNMNMPFMGSLAMAKFKFTEVSLWK